MEASSNSYLATGHARTANARTRMRNGWSDIARALNSDGSGCVKDWKQWAKYWKDKKAAVKRKASNAEAARRKTGGGVDEEVVELTDVEQRILTIAGGLSFATGDSNLRINPLPEQENEAPLPAGSETNSGQSESLLLQNPGPSGCHTTILIEDGIQWDDTAAACLGEGSVQDIYTSPPITASLAPSGGTVGAIQNEDETMSLSEAEGARVPEGRSVMQSPTGSTVRPGEGGRTRRRILVATPRASRRGAGGTTLPSQSGASPRRRRPRGESAAARRRLMRRSPPSQRRSEMVSLTERFIAIEERRVETQHSIARSQEMFAQGQLQMAEAVNKLTNTINIATQQIIEVIQHH